MPAPDLIIYEDNSGKTHPGSYDPSDVFLGHPKGLYVLFLTEMWERMSYYGMRALLVLYMVKYLLVRPDVQNVVGYTAFKRVMESVYGPLAVQQMSSIIYGLYTSFVYLTPFFGGIIADRWLGRRNMVYVGGVLMAIGHFLMAGPDWFFLALLFIILGNGAFKPNISTQVGDLYAPGDTRRDGAFTIFYMGINLGAFMSPLICGTLGQKLGWHWGFGAAGVGMILGLTIYYVGQKYIKPHPANFQQSLPEQKKPDVAAKGATRMTGEEWKIVLALAALCLLNAVFWAVYEQQGNTMQLWADNQTDWNFFGWEMPSTWYQSFNPLMILIFAPILGIFWRRQSERQREPSSVIKMAIGCLLLGLAFVVMVGGAFIVGDGKGSVIWLIATAFALTLGELYLSPVGLSLVTKVAPARMVSMLMGVWLMSNFIGNYFSGYLGSFYEQIPHSAFFAIMAGLSLATALAIAAFNKPLRAALGRH